jgi:hypothetical protein
LGGGKCLNGFPFSEMGISSLDGLRMDVCRLLSTSGGSFVVRSVFRVMLSGSSSECCCCSSQEDMDEDSSESMAVSPNVRKLSSFRFSGRVVLLLMMASIFAIETVVVERCV